MGIRSLKTASISTGAKRSKFWDQSSIIQTTAFDSIQTYTLGSAQSTVTFSSIPQTYKYLEIHSVTFGTGTTMVARLNGDSGSNYTFHRVMSWGSGAPESAGQTGRPDFAISYVGGSTTSKPLGNIMYFNDYSDTNKNTTFTSLNGVDNNGSGNVGIWSGLWNNTAAVTSISFRCEDGSNFQANTTFALYGIKG